VMIVLIMKVGV